FQRAATLLCACELLRLDDPNAWGDSRFSIGLWLGMHGTPNTHDESRRSLARIQQDPSEEGANPCQLESCPWCGEALEPNHYWTDGEARRTRVACPRRECQLGFGVPLHLSNRDRKSTRLNSSHQIISYAVFCLKKKKKKKIIIE